MGGQTEEVELGSKRNSRWTEGVWRLGRTGCVCGVGRCHSWSGRRVWWKVEAVKTRSPWTMETSTILFCRWLDFLSEEGTAEAEVQSQRNDSESFHRGHYKQGRIFCKESSISLL